MIKIADPTNATTVPHLLGVTLDSTGVAKTQVVFKNRTNDETQIVDTDSNKIAVIDSANFTSGYVAGDVIEVVNVGASKGIGTITINSATGGFQDVTITCSSAVTVAVNL